MQEVGGTPQNYSGAMVSMHLPIQTTCQSLVFPATRNRFDSDFRVKNMIAQFVTLYELAAPKWHSIADLSTHMGWTSITNQTMADYLRSEKGAESYIGEFVEALTRVNYGHVRSLDLLLSFAFYIARCRMRMRYMLSKASVRWQRKALLVFRVVISRFLRNSSRNPVPT